MNQPRQPHEQTAKNGVNLLIGMAMAVSAPLRDILAKFHTVGPRELNSPSRLWGGLWLAVCLATGPDVLLWVGGLWLLAQMIHRARPGKGHSRSCGAPPIGRGPHGWAAVGLLGLFAAVMASEWDQAFALWLGVACAGHLLTVSVGTAMIAAERRDVRDALIDAQHRHEEW